MTVYTPKTLAEHWKCSAQHVRNMIADGTLPAFRVGDKLLRIRGDVVEAFECQANGELPDSKGSAASHGTNSAPTAAASAGVSASVRVTPLKPTAEHRQRMRKLRARWKREERAREGRSSEKPEK